MSRNSLSHFDIGIDLGTTNCLLAFKGKDSQDHASLLNIEQFDSQDALIKHNQLPSFLYLPQKHERKKDTFNLEWRRENRSAIGRMARSLQHMYPDRVVMSAKSWLANKAVDRTAPMLPWQSMDVGVDERISPVDVSAQLLAYLSDYWDATIAVNHQKYRFAKQNIVITVPASFDESAQALTLEAAKKAGFPVEHIQLLEEPLAAFYHWLHMVTAGGDKANTLRVMEQKLTEKPLCILVADIGGGTTDFSMFKLTSIQPLAVERTAVSDHLLLGGDNIDLALARIVELKIFGRDHRANNREFSQLVSQARQVKESFLSDRSRTGGYNDGVLEPPSEYSFSVTSGGQSLFASSKTGKLTRQEIEQVLFEGFFPECNKDEGPTLQQGLREFGLPYAKDIAITRHMAAFVQGAAIDALLVNGGSLKSSVLQQRLIDQITKWNGFEPLLLESESEDTAVALGASYFAGITSQQMVVSNYPRSVYLVIQEHQGRSSGAASPGTSYICIIQKGMKRSETVTLDQLDLKLRLGRPVVLKVFTCHDLPDDQVGEVYQRQHFAQHAVTYLPTFTNKFVLDGKQKQPQHNLPVKLMGRVSEAGLLELSIVSNDPAVAQSWDMNFDLSERVNENTFLEEDQFSTPALVGQIPVPVSDWRPAISQAELLLQSLYGKGKPADTSAEPKTLIRQLEQVFKTPRQQWPAHVLRELWPALQLGMTRKGRSAAHEATWFNVAGYSLRPGFGYPGDPWRMDELSEVIRLGMNFPKDHAVEDQWFIMWRRVAGGLSGALQMQLYSKVYPRLLKEGQDTQELWRFVGSLERLPIDEKVKLGQLIVKKLLAGKKSFLDQKLWVLMRLSTREPLHAGLDSVLPSDVVAAWLRDLMGSGAAYSKEEKMQKVFLFGIRQTGLRDLDMLPQFRIEVSAYLAKHGLSQEQLKSIDQVRPLSLSQREDLYGESLPTGIVLGI